MIVLDDYNDSTPYKCGRVIETISELKWLANKMKNLEEFAYDTEVNTLRVNGDSNEFKFIGISISWSSYDNYYIPVGHVFDNNQVPLKWVVKYLKPIFENPNIRLIGWNIKFDMHVLARIGIYPKTKDLFDGMIASWLCNENTPNGLKDNTKEILGIDQTHFADVLTTVTNEEKKMYGLKASQKPTYDLVRIEHGSPYALNDSYFTWELYKYFLDKLEDEGMTKIYYRQYVPFIRTLFTMEEKGVTIDVPKLEQMSVDMQKDIDELRYSIYEIAGVEFNPSSNQQLAELLFGYADSKNPNPHILEVSFNFPVVSTTAKGLPQTSAKVLDILSKKTYKTARKQEGVELVKSLLKYSKLIKLQGFVEGFKDKSYADGKVHPNFNIIGTDSGRISCSEPNLQQLPKAEDDDKYQIRSLFIGSIDEVTGKRKKIIALDYKNLEMVLLTHFSEDKNLTTCFTEEHDSHGDTAVNMFRLDCTADECKKKYPHLRQVGKVLNFLLMYGGGASTLRDTLEAQDFNTEDPKLLKEYKVKNGLDLCQKFIDMYFDSYKGVANFIKGQKKFAHRNEYVLTITGRKRRLENINSDDFRTSSYEERLSVNSCVQGSAGDVTSYGQNRIMSDPYIAETLRCNMIIQVHDELVFECPEENVEEAIKCIKRYMEHPFGDDVELYIPLTVDADFGDSYQEAK